MNEVKHSSARSVTAFVLGIIFIAASFVVWDQTDLQGNDAVFGVWLGLGCLAWTVIWMVLAGSSGAGQFVARAAAFVAAAMAAMVGTDYLDWDQAGLYLLEVLAVIAITSGIFNWLGRTEKPDSETGPPMNHSSLAFMVGILFIVASLMTWAWTDIPQDEMFWGVWVGLSCWGWTILWMVLSKSSDANQVLAQVASLAAVVLAIMASVDYLAWEEASLYLLEAMAVISVGFGIGHWLDQPESDLEPA